MEIGPIWRAMWRNKSGYILIALQIAVTLAIMVNAVAIIQERSGLMARASGIDEDNIFHATSLVFAPDLDQRSLINEDLAALREIPGVIDAIATNSVPMRNGGWSMGLQVEPGVGVDGTGTAIYFTDDHGIETFGLNLVAGRDFRPEEITWNEPDEVRWPPSVIITRALAEALFPDESFEDVVGKTVYINQDDPMQVLGIVDRMQAPWVGWESVERSALVPMLRESSITRYVVRTQPGMLNELMPVVEELLATRSDNRIIDGLRTMADTRKRAYLDHASMIKMLSFIVTLLITITALGIVGLASFSVTRRTRQIGTRRALGATRPEILRYFVLENLIVSICGTTLGAGIAIGLNIWMVSAFDLAPMSWPIVPVAMLALIGVGLLATAGPARRASLVPPAVATRAV
ncbi:MAG: ABC transporter permease [Gammaproteobacteria bacterium]|nr:ABC transporter permease [Gammaproteobacteria bacterium]MDH4255610.1 ABC transporter permease [Gammaproteobacteria bacterium]MDH5310340.1 ABC transporter permease [Gammaproteobacteria bacterium]